MVYEITLIAGSTEKACRKLSIITARIISSSKKILPRVSFILRMDLEGMVAHLTLFPPILTLQPKL